MYNNWCNGQVCPRYESSQNFVQTDRIEEKIIGDTTGYRPYVSGSIVVLMEGVTALPTAKVSLVKTIPERPATV